MAVVHHVDHARSDSGSGMGFLAGIVVLAIVLFLLFYYGLPLIRNASTQQAPQIQVPDKIDVNLNNGQR